MIPSREWPGGAVAAARFVNAVFFLAVASFCVLCYSPFVYGMFIKPDVSPLLTDFVTLSPWLYLLALLITTLTVMPQLRGAAPAALARSYIAAGIIVVVWLFAARPLTTLANTPRALVYAIGALIAPVWLAVIDHRARPAPALTPTDRSRIVATALLAAAVAWLFYTAAMPIRLHQAVGIDLTTRAMATGAAASLTVSLFVFAALALAMLTCAGLAEAARRPAVVEYWLFVALVGACASLVLALVVCASIGVSGPGAWIVSAAMGATIAIAWADVARLRSRSCTALELLCAPVAGVRSRGAALAAAAIAAGAVSYVVVSAASQFDWNFLLQKLSVLLVWLATFAIIGSALSARAIRARSAAWHAASLVAVFLLFQGLQRFDLHVVLDRYAAVDPSFHLIHDALTARSAETVEYYAYLQSNTLVVPRTVRTPDTPFVDAWPPTPARKPDVYLFLIDSLRRDYLSPYNPGVTFTPEIAKLAADSDVFDRAFTRYSGTALAVPSIWAGGMVIHAIEQPDFDRRNTLVHLLAADGYRQIMDVDNVVEEFLPGDPARVQLDRGRGTMQFDVCRTIDELEQRVTENANRQPIFFYELPQNVHIAIAARRKVPDGETYPGFFAPVASAVRRVDGCLGGFVDFLKRSGRYDDSVIILTSDHGDSLGEEGRWGHGYFVVPEVMRVPLIVHVPSRMRAAVAADLSAVTFSTDITPSLYALLGHNPRDLGPLFGRPLFVPPDAPPSPRRRGEFLVASSYGAVYGMLRQNGRRLYVVDAVDGRDDLFEMDDAVDAPGRRLELTRAAAAAGRAAIRGQIDAIASMYGYAAAAGPRSR